MQSEAPLNRQLIFRGFAMGLCVVAGICIDVPLAIMRAVPEAPFWQVMNSTIATHAITAVCLVAAAICLVLGDD